MRRLLVLALPLALGGCGLPPAVTAVAWLMDGASLAGTGKTMSDQALSAVTAQDCALWRLVKGEVVCHAPGEPNRPSMIALAAANTVYPGLPPEDTGRVGSGPAAAVPRAADAADGWRPILTVGPAGPAAWSARTRPIATQPCKATGPIANCKASRADRNG